MPSTADSDTATATSRTQDDRITLRFLSTPSDTAAGGRSVAAGSVMEWIDKAGYACAVGWAGGYCVTAYVGNMRHRRPIRPQSLVEVQARIIHTGRTSIHVVVTVSSAQLNTRSFKPATTCILIFVAKGADGLPAPVPAWVPRTPADRDLAGFAADRIHLRAEIKRRTLAMDYPDAATAPREVFRFLAPPSAVNWGGKAHGGTVMRWIDEGAYAVAAAWVGATEPAVATDVVAVYSGGIHFFAPVQIGDVVEVEARLLHTGPRSMHLGIRVSTAEARTPQVRTLTTQCMTVFVLPGADGRARPVAQWRPRDEAERRLRDRTCDLLELREQVVPIPATLTLEP